MTISQGILSGGINGQTAPSGGHGSEESHGFRLSAFHLILGPDDPETTDKPLPRSF